MRYTKMALLGFGLGLLLGLVVIAAESSIKMGASDRTPNASLIRRHSYSSMKPVRTRWESTWASMQSNLWTSCSVDISRLKIAAGA